MSAIRPRARHPVKWPAGKSPAPYSAADPYMSVLRDCSSILYGVAQLLVVATALGEVGVVALAQGADRPIADADLVILFAGHGSGSSALRKTKAPHIHARGSRSTHSSTSTASPARA